MWHGGALFWNVLLKLSWDYSDYAQKYYFIFSPGLFAPSITFILFKWYTLIFERKIWFYLVVHGNLSIVFYIWFLFSFGFFNLLNSFCIECCCLEQGFICVCTWFTRFTVMFQSVFRVLLHFVYCFCFVSFLCGTIHFQDLGTTSLTLMYRQFFSLIP